MRAEGKEVDGQPLIDSEDFKAGTERIEGMIKTLVQFGIPGFFYISGVANACHDTDSYGFATFAKRKVLRLFVPLLFAMIFLLVPRLYMVREFDVIG